jgi:acyl-CoA synthetase (AMP-forming)/AMP-acid ligase II
MLSNENVCCHAHQALIEFGFGPNDTWSHFAPMYHLVDAYAMYSITWVGGCHTLLPTWDARAALHQMADYRVTTTHVAATMLQMLITNPERANVSLDALRLISCGGSALPLPLVTQAFDAFGPRFFTSYGMTECTGKISVSRLQLTMLALPKDEQITLVGSQGKPFTGMEIRVLREDGSRAPIGEVGEVQIRGRTVRARAEPLLAQACSRCNTHASHREVTNYPPCPTYSHSHPHLRVVRHMMPARVWTHVGVQGLLAARRCDCRGVR